MIPPHVITPTDNGKIKLKPLAMELLSRLIQLAAGQFMAGISVEPFGGVKIAVVAVVDTVRLQVSCLRTGQQSITPVGFALETGKGVFLGPLQFTGYQNRVRRHAELHGDSFQISFGLSWCINYAVDPFMKLFCRMASQGHVKIKALAIHTCHTPKTFPSR